jgi:hypothetical protein
MARIYSYSSPQRGRWKYASVATWTLQTAKSRGNGYRNGTALCRRPWGIITTAPPFYFLCEVSVYPLRSRACGYRLPLALGLYSLLWGLARFGPVIRGSEVRPAGKKLSFYLRELPCLHLHRKHIHAPCIIHKHTIHHTPHTIHKPLIHHTCIINYAKERGEKTKTIPYNVICSARQWARSKIDPFTANFTLR